MLILNTNHVKMEIMTKLITLFVMILLLGGCVGNDIHQAKPTSTTRLLRIEVIDSCEYVVYRDGYAGGVTHHGNCKYCRERVGK